MGMYQQMKRKAIPGTSVKYSGKVVKTVKRGDIEELNLSMQSIGEQSRKEKESMGITMYARGDIYSSMNTSFEDRYKNLLEDIDEEELTPLPNIHENNVVESIDEVDCVENGFIARYCLGNVVSIDEAPQPAKGMTLKK